MKRQNQQLKSPEMHLWLKETRTVCPLPPLMSLLLSLFRVLWRCARVNNCSDVELKNQLSLKTDAQAALIVEATHVGGTEGDGDGEQRQLKCVVWAIT